MQDFGPRVPESKHLAVLLQSGLKIARLKLAFGDKKRYSDIIKKLRHQAKKLGKSVDILVELKGPRLAVAQVDRAGLELLKDQNIIIASTYDLKDFNSQTLPSVVIPVNYPFLAHSLKKGQEIGLGHTVKAQVSRIEDNFIYARVLKSGTVLSGDELSIPYLKIKTDCITGQDIDDLQWAVKQEVDFVMPRLVRDKQDIIFLKKIIQNKAKVLAPINSLAIWAKRAEILKVADGFLLDTHSLAHEVPQIKLDLIKKEFTNKNHATEKIHLMV